MCWFLFTRNRSVQFVNESFRQSHLIQTQKNIANCQEGLLQMSKFTVNKLNFRMFFIESYDIALEIRKIVQELFRLFLLYFIAYLVPF